MAKAAAKARARGWERKRANRDTYEEIIAAAAQAFSKNGYDGTSLAEIAKAVGIKTPALYYHFKSKNEILHAYLLRCADEIITPVQEAVGAAGEDAVERLRAYVRSYIRSQLERIDTMPMINTIIFNSSVSKALTRAQNKWLRDWERKMIEILRGILADGQRAGVFEFKDLGLAAFFIMGSIDFVVNWYRPDGKMSFDEIAEDYASMAVASVRA